MSSSMLAVSHDGDGEVDVVAVRGELDLTSAGALEDALSHAHRRSVVLDLSLLAFVDSAGIRSIDLAHRRLRDAGRSLVVVAPPESRAAWTFRVAGFDSHICFDSLDAAIEGIGAAGE
jgi:anti-anti-sigma factor